MPDLSETIDAAWADVAGWLSGLGESGRRRAYAAAAAAVAVSFGAHLLFDLPGFWLFNAAVALAAATGVASAATGALIASFLILRLVGEGSLFAHLLFAAEGSLIAFIVLRLTSALANERRRMAAAESRLIELKGAERQARSLETAFSLLDGKSAETALIVLDRAGLVADWRAAAARLYGRPAAEMIGTGPAALFADLSEDEVAALLTQAREHLVRHAGPQRRGDGQTFAAAIEIEPLSRGGFDGFAMIVRDLTHEQAREARASSTAQAYEELQTEAGIAHQQLTMLREVTDPELNSLAGDELAAMVLERLRASIDAEGIALVHLDGIEPRVLCAAGGQQCTTPARRIASRRPDHRRALMIHNDPAGVAEMSCAGWPEGLSSLIAVPVARAGSAKAVVEVVNRGRRRATEWEIALVQVVAGRIAGSLQESALAEEGSRGGDNYLAPGRVRR